MWKGNRIFGEGGDFPSLVLWFASLTTPQGITQCFDGKWCYWKDYPNCTHLDGFRRFDVSKLRACWILVASRERITGTAACDSHRSFHRAQSRVRHLISEVISVTWNELFLSLWLKFQPLANVESHKVIEFVQPGWFVCAVIQRIWEQLEAVKLFFYLCGNQMHRSPERKRRIQEALEIFWGKEYFDFLLIS